MHEHEKFSTLIFTIVTLFLLALVPVGLKCFWSDSEMWAVTSNFHMFSNGWHNHFIKPFFGIFLMLVTKLGNALGINIMDASRFVFSLNSLLAIALLYRLSFLVTKNKLLSGLVLLLVVCSSYFWERSFRVRSDLITLTLYLIVLNLIYSTSWNSKKRILCYLLMVVNIFFTAKSLLLMSIVTFSFRDQLMPKKIKVKVLISFICLLALLVATNREAIDFFLKSFGQSTGEMPYWHLARWEHVVRFVSKNGWLLIVFLLPLLSRLSGKKWADDMRYFTFLFLLVFWIVVHPNKFPFFLYSLYPLLVLGFVNNPLTKKYLAIIKEKKVFASLFLCTILYLSYSGMQRALFVYSHHNNSEQKSVQDKICTSLEAFPATQVLDPVGVCPLRFNSYFWFFGPSSDNKSFVKSIVEYKVDIIFLTAKTLYLEPELSQSTKENYFKLGSGLLVRALSLSNKKNELNPDKIKKAVQDSFGVEIFNYVVDFSDLKKKVEAPAVSNSGISKSLSLTKKDSLSESYAGKFSEPFVGLEDYNHIKVSPFYFSFKNINGTMNSLFRHDSEL